MPKLQTADENARGPEPEGADLPSNASGKAVSTSSGDPLATLDYLDGLAAAAEGAVELAKALGVETGGAGEVVSGAATLAGPLTACVEGVRVAEEGSKTAEALVDCTDVIPAVTGMVADASAGAFLALPDSAVTLAAPYRHRDPLPVLFALRQKVWLLSSFAYRGTMRATDGRKGFGPPRFASWPLDVRLAYATTIEAYATVGMMVADHLAEGGDVQNPIDVEAFWSRHTERQLTAAGVAGTVAAFIPEPVLAAAVAAAAAAYAAIVKALGDNWSDVATNVTLGPEARSVAARWSVELAAEVEFGGRVIRDGQRLASLSRDRYLDAIGAETWPNVPWLDASTWTPDAWRAGVRSPTLGTPAPKLTEADLGWSSSYFHGWRWAWHQWFEAVEGELDYPKLTAYLGPSNHADRLGDLLPLGGYLTAINADLGRSLATVRKNLAQSAALGAGNGSTSSTSRGGIGAGWLALAALALGASR